MELLRLATVTQWGHLHHAAEGFSAAVWLAVVSAPLECGHSPSASVLQVRFVLLWLPLQLLLALLAKTSLVGLRTLLMLLHPDGWLADLFGVEGGAEVLGCLPVSPLWLILAVVVARPLFAVQAARLATRIEQFQVHDGDKRTRWNRCC